MKTDLRVTLFQSDLYWQSADANLSAFEEKIWQLEEETDLIVLPEMFNSGFTMEPAGVAEPVNGRTYRWMKQIAKQTQATVMGSLVVKEQYQYFNRLVIMDPSGDYQHYDKKHLFSLAGEHQSFTAGKNREVVIVKGWRLLPLVCYDLRFPVWSRSINQDEKPTYEYDALVYVANWPEARIRAWDTLLQARAIENTSYALGVNRIGKDGNEIQYTGHSAVYDYVGEGLAFLGEADTMQTVSLSASQLQKFRTNFPFQADADTFTLSE